MDKSTLKIFWIACAAALLGLLAGCGAENPTPTPASSLPSPAPTTATLTVGTINPPVSENTPLPTRTAQPEADPVRPLPPVNTVSNLYTPPNPTASPRPGGVIAPPYTPPRTLDPQAPANLPGGLKQILPGSFVVATEQGLYLLNAQGQNEKRLAGGAGFSDPRIAPDGQRVAVFTMNRLSRKGQLALVEAGGGLKAINPEAGGVFLSASWSPDSKWLALTRATDTNGDGQADDYDETGIVLYELASGKQQLIGEGRYPAWSPDGVRIVYLSGGSTAEDYDPSTRQLRRGPNAVAVYNIINRGKRTLLESKAAVVSLGRAGSGSIGADVKLPLRYFKAVAFHPDSKHITASADVTGPNGIRAGVIVTMTLEDTTPRVVGAAGDAAGQVLWSPDGTRLVFETVPQFPVGPNSAAQIALLEGAAPEQASPVKVLLGNPANRTEARQPLWLSNDQLAYLEGDRRVLTVAGINGQNPQRLIADCSGFDWR